MLRDMSQTPKVRFIACPWTNNLSTMQVTSLPVLFSFLVSCSGIPVIKSQSVWPDDDGYRNTERARVYLSIVGGANPNLELSCYFLYFSVNPKAAVIATQLRMTFNKPQSSRSKYEGTRYSHGLRNYANINYLCVINHKLVAKRIS